MSAGSGLGVVWHVPKSSYIIMPAAWDRFRVGYVSLEGMFTNTSQRSSSSW